MIEPMPGRSAVLSLLLILSACAAAPAQRPAAVQAPVRVIVPPAGLEGVMGRTARVLTGLFGKPDLDVREGAARKLQFVGPACVLDTYLYPAEGGGEPIVTHIDSRHPDGGDMDRASCIAALSRRQQAR